MKLDDELFGFYVNTSPVTQKKKKFTKVISLDMVEKNFDKKVEVVGQITKIRVIVTKNNEEMAFLEIADEIAKAEVVVFPQIYKMVKPFNKEEIVYINGKVKRRFADYQIEAISLQKLD